MKRFFLILSLLLLLFTVTVSSHPGRTDSNGGHWDRKEGTYHYHSGEYAGRNSSGSSSETSKNDNKDINIVRPPYVEKEIQKAPVKEIKKNDINDLSEEEQQPSEKHNTFLTYILVFGGLMIFVIIVVLIVKGCSIDDLGCLPFILIVIIVFLVLSSCQSESEELEEPETYESHIERCDGSCDHIQDALNDAFDEYIKSVETYQDHVDYCDGTCDHIENEIEHRISDLGEICYLDGVYDYFDVYSREDLQRAYIQGYGDCYYGNAQEYSIKEYKNENVFDE